MLAGLPTVILIGFGVEKLYLPQDRSRDCAQSAACRPEITTITRIGRVKCRANGADGSRPWGWPVFAEHWRTARRPQPIQNWWRRQSRKASSRSTTATSANPQCRSNVSASSIPRSRSRPTSRPAGKPTTATPPSAAAGRPIADAFISTDDVFMKMDDEGMLEGYASPELDAFSRGRAAGQSQLHPLQGAACGVHGQHRADERAADPAGLDRLRRSARAVEGQDLVLRSAHLVARLHRAGDAAPAIGRGAVRERSTRD